MTNVTDNSSRNYLREYRDQIDALERAAAISDPSGASSYDEGLEQQFAAMQQEVGARPGMDGTPSCHRRHDHSHHRSDLGWGSSNLPSLNSTVRPVQLIGGGGSIDNANLPSALRQYAPMIDAASRATGVPADVLAAQLWQESRGQAGATSVNPGNGETDVGLMQINPDTFAQLQQEHPELRGRLSSDPATNVLAADYLMGDLLKQYGGNLDDALRVYNSGAVDLANPNVTPGGVGDPNYVKSVSSFVADLRNGTPLPS